MEQKTSGKRHRHHHQTVHLWDISSNPISHYRLEALNFLKWEHFLHYVTITDKYFKLTHIPFWRWTMNNKKSEFEVIIWWILNSPTRVVVHQMDPAKEAEVKAWLKQKQLPQQVPN